MHLVPVWNSLWNKNLLYIFCLGKEGTDCAQDIDECLSSPCQNGGTCHNEEGRYRCECQQVTVNLTRYGNGQKLEFLSGFKGDNCEVDINECHYSSPSICLHNGSCTNTHGDYNCLCGSVYDGVYATGQPYCIKCIFTLLRRLSKLILLTYFVFVAIWQLLSILTWFDFDIS